MITAYKEPHRFSDEGSGSSFSDGLAPFAHIQHQEGH